MSDKFFRKITEGMASVIPRYGYLIPGEKFEGAARTFDERNFISNNLPQPHFYGAQRPAEGPLTTTLAVKAWPYLQFERDWPVGIPMFCAAGVGSASASRRGQLPSCLLSLPQLNAVLNHLHKSPREPGSLPPVEGDVFDPARVNDWIGAPEASRFATNARALKAAFNYLGVLVNKSETVDTVVIAVRGRQSVPNFWGMYAVVGTHVGFVCKRTSVGDTAGPFTLKPWVGSTRATPSALELRYFDGVRVPRAGCFYYVGSVLRTEVKTERDEETLAYYVNDIIGAPAVPNAYGLSHAGLSSGMPYDAIGCIDLALGPPQMLLASAY